MGTNFDNFFISFGVRRKEQGWQSEGVSRVKGKCVRGAVSSTVVGNKMVDERTTEHQCPGKEGLGHW